jgi:hypothetical protein
LAQYTDSLAGQLDRFSHTLRDREIGSIIDDAKQLAYRQPELFVVGALAAGFVLGRFFKSSSRAMRRYENDYYQSDYEYPYGYDYSYGYNEYDPRDQSRSYGERYGQSYSGQFSRGPETSGYYEGGARTQSGYQGEYGSRYGQPSSGQYGQGQYSQGQYGQGQYGQGQGEWREQWSRRESDQWGQRSGSQSGQSGQSSHYTSTGQSSQGAQGSQSGHISQSGAFGQGTSQVTTHGMGTGESMRQEEELRRSPDIAGHSGQESGQKTQYAQEFGQGEEQVSNYKGNETEKASDLAKHPQDREEGKLR